MDPITPASHLPINMSPLNCNSSLFSFLPPSPPSINYSPAMLSTFPATTPSDAMFGTHFPSFENGFTPWDVEPSSDIFSLLESSTPVATSSGSEDKPNRTQANSNSSSEDHPEKPVSVIDERKRRRMISNRESARRSRMRKQKHLENLRNQVNRLRIENRELSNRLRLVLYNSHRIRTDNDRLRSEQIMLRQKLSNIRHILLLQQLQQSTPPPAWPSNNNVNVALQ